jgi:hypothetical protein
MKMVYPSGSELATAAAAMLVPAPGLFSTHHLLAPDPRQPVGSDAGDRVGRSARRIRDYNAHGAGGPALRQRWTAHPGYKRERRTERPCSHAAERSYQCPPSDPDWHVPLSVRGLLHQRLPHREYAVSTFG